MASTCRSCGAPITWATTREKKSRIPLDADPVGEKGVYDLEPSREVPGQGWVRFASVVPAAERAGRNLYNPHHMTCPQGKSWRRS